MQRISNFCIRQIFVCFLLVAIFFIMDCQQKPKTVFEKGNLVAWCIVPFDAKERGPKERAEMLKKLGITKIAYDWRDKHIPTFDEELSELHKQSIRMIAFWWTGGWKENSTEIFQSPVATTIFEFLKRNHLKLELWATLSDAGIETLTDEKKYENLARRVDVLALELDKIGCRLSLYNHGGWGGVPHNMIETIKQVKSRNVGIVYNFHHAHEQLGDFPAAFKAMVPYLTCVNLNGMNKDGPKILPLGKGSEDRWIIEMIQNSGYLGPIGIIGHRSDADVEMVLNENMKGLVSLLHEIGDYKAVETYQ
jgi:sugar phosphate isomerase/epimerase